MKELVSKSVVLPPVEFRLAYYRLLFAVNGVSISEAEVRVMELLDRYVGDDNDITTEARSKAIAQWDKGVHNFNAVVSRLKKKGLISGHLLNPIYRLPDDEVKVCVTIIRNSDVKDKE